MAHNNVEIRRAAPQDIPDIASVLLAAFAEYEPLYTQGGFAATTPTSDQIRTRFDEGPVWIALLDGAISGTVAAILRDGATLYVRSMAVLRAARGHNIGGALLGEVERFATEHGCKRLLLSTTPFLARAIRLYERAGFQLTEEGPSDLFGTPLVAMAKSL
ncbi:MAG TPA: GNAT family N-acetyltransferase [Ktedonobacterales bacterium]|nr:GNAT family N-acetyltransferase [Ktedonobacterales bacterium]